MKTILRSAIIAAAFAIPAVTYAQDPVTRTQVRDELVQLQSVGYHVGDGDQAQYPSAIQAAEAKLSAQRGSSGYGGASNATSQSGSRVSASDWNTMYTR
ncbi:DUF4148 domain-containing protein [Paraburkholderia acidicola]|uniref:DUF4148 domain-containing protein n=1 Tax=Paraburkholderia acidicola TaxID=1912599 RepID=A0ABV1LY06_9BURK